MRSCLAAPSRNEPCYLLKDLNPLIEAVGQLNQRRGYVCHICRGQRDHWFGRFIFAFFTKRFFLGWCFSLVYTFAGTQQLAQKGASAEMG